MQVFLLILFIKIYFKKAMSQIDQQIDQALNNEAQLLNKENLEFSEPKQPENVKITFLNQNDIKLSLENRKKQ